MTRLRPPKDILKRREKKPPTRLLEHTATDWKFWAGTAIGVAGLLLAVLAAEDRPTLSIGAPSDVDNPVSVQALVVNNGVLPIRNVTLECYVKREVRPGNVGRPDVSEGGLFPASELPIGILRVGEPTDFDVAYLLGAHEKYLELDAAVVAHFSPVWAPFWKRHRFFRLAITAKHRTLHQIPAENIEEDYWETRQQLDMRFKQLGLPIRH